MRDVAAQLAMSTRRLQRRLGDENTSFQAVLVNAREALAARHYLANSATAIAEVSFLLGYADPSSFCRAFHDWTGETPAQVRSGVADREQWRELGHCHADSLRQPRCTHSVEAEHLFVSEREFELTSPIRQRTATGARNRQTAAIGDRPGH